MKIYGYVMETYGKFVKVRTKDGEVVIKSEKANSLKDKKTIEIKNSGYGDLKAKIVAGPSQELPSLKSLQLVDQYFGEVDFATQLANFLDELSKRIIVDSEFLKKLRDYIYKEKDEEFEYVLKLLSGRYGLLSNGNLVIFLDKILGTFEIFGEDTTGKITGLVKESEVVVYFEKIPQKVDELYQKLKQYFGSVVIKKEGYENGFYG